MHALDLVDLANTFSRLAATQLSLGSPASRLAAQDYWLLSRYRHENWMEHLARHRDAIDRVGTSFRRQRWHAVLPVLQEILLSEVLTRIVAYYAGVLELRRIDVEFASLARSTLVAHIEARNRCLHLIVFGPGLPVEHAVQLNRLRRCMEQVTDRTLAVMPPLENSSEFCFEPQAVARSQQQFASVGWSTTWITLHLLALTESYWKSTQSMVDWRVANARLNYRLSQTVLRFLSAEAFDSLGVPYSARMGRLAAESS
ncbi:MAG: hypothetical protein KDA45_09060, partial [Planctomycetales bacterium]|nr:hypothetical protein [Planctomycetales bacterium]